MGFLQRALPFETTIGDRIFLAVASMIAIGFLWLRFLSSVTIWGALIISIVFGAILVKWG
jgi:predicted small integral membrane protein